MRSGRAIALILMLALLATGCARRFLALPEQARDGNDLDWTVESEPVPRGEEEP
ncbi:MAG: hypothetical protein QNK03_16825 [Myxococcota bacterium]|nr:hypothetical protein [Myxococcota bacterium]